MAATRRRAPATPKAATRSKAKSPFDITSSTKLDDYLLPFVLFCLVVPVIGMGAYAWCQRSTAARILVPLALIAIAGVLFFALWHEAKARTVHNRARAAAAAAWLFLEPAVTIVVGPTSYAWTTVWLLVGLAFGVWFIFRKQEVVRGDGSDGHEQADDPFAVQVGLHASTRAKVIEDSPTRMKLRVIHEWDPAKNVAAAFETIARLKHLPAAGIRVIPTDDSAVSEVELMKVDMFKHSSPWPGPSAPGKSIAVPCRVGVMQDGEPMEIVRPGDDEAGRPAIHTITMGMSGSGKTKFMMNEVSEMVTRYDVVIWLSDTAKAAQTVGYFRPAVDWLVTTPAQTRMMVQALDRIITKRAALLGQHDFEQWTPEAFEILGMPYLYVGFQEAARILGGDADPTPLIRLGEALRSVGGSLDFSLQRASHGNMPTDLRAVMGSGICFGVKEDIDAQMVLSDETLEQGANPSAWRTNKPGACYIEASHVDQTRWSMPGRTHNIGGQELREHVAEWARKMSALDRASAEAAGQPHAERQTVSVDEWMKAVRSPKRLIALGGGKPASPNGIPNGSPNGSPNGDPNTRTVAVLDRAEHPNGSPNGDDPNDADDDPNEPTPEEIEQMAADDAEDMRTLLEELREGDPEFGPEDLAEFMAVDPREEFDPDSAPDVDLGDAYAEGQPLTYEQKCSAFAYIVNLLFRAAGDPEYLDTTTEQMFDEWAVVPGINVKAPGEVGSPRPSLSRLLRKAEAAGMLEDRGRGKWRLLREIRSWDPTQRVLGDTDSEGDDTSPGGAGDDAA